MSAAPYTTIDWRIDDGVRDIEIEERDGAEVTHIQGRLSNGELALVEIGPSGVTAANPAFDVTPAELIDGLFTDRGFCKADKASMAALFGR